MVDWANFRDDEIVSDEVAPGLVIEDEEYISKCRYDGDYKVTVTSKIISTRKLKSNFIEELKEKMKQNCDIDEDAYQKNVDKEVHIELPRSLRKFDEDNINMFDKPSNIFQPLVKDSVKEKFKQLKLLDDEKLSESNIAAVEEQTAPMPIPTPSTTLTTSYGNRNFRQNREQGSIRVTNLSEETSEEDLANLFGKIGKVERIYLAREKDTKKSKGFAFITYADSTIAAEAIRKLDRHGHDCLLLRVEWAQPVSARFKDPLLHQMKI